MSNLTDTLKLALKKAFDLGKRYWQQANSDFTSQWRKSDVTLASFNQLVEDTIRDALAEQPAQQGPVACKSLCELCVKRGYNSCANAAQTTPIPVPQPAQQQDSETIVQTFTGLPKRKLRDLLAAGWQINGVCFQRTEENGTVRRGAATTGGMVLWWNQPAQQQEPVAWMYEQQAVRTELGVGGWDRKLLFCEPAPEKFKRNITPLYTAPPRREWIGLTFGEQTEIIERYYDDEIDLHDFARTIESKLKEKNYGA